MIAQSVDEEILTAIDRSARARVPRLRLNLDDNDYFRARLTNAAPVPSPSKVSHELIDRAFCEAREQVKRIVSGFDEKDHGDTLGWRPRAVGRRARRRGGGAPRTLAGNRRTAADRGRGQERHVRDGGPRRRPGADSRAAPAGCGTSLREVRLEPETRNSRGRTARLPRPRRAEVLQADPQPATSSAALRHRA